MPIKFIQNYQMFGIGIFTLMQIVGLHITIPMVGKHIATYCTLNLMDTFKYI